MLKPRTVNFVLALAATAAGACGDARGPAAADDADARAGGALPASAPLDCGVLARAPQAPADGRATTFAHGIWATLVPRYLALTPLGQAAPKLVVLAPEAALPAGAWTCPSLDTVFVSDRLAVYAHARAAADGTDFLAFVLAHELAHRRFDADDRAFGEARCPRASQELESLADQRAAFLVAQAWRPGEPRARYSPFVLERHEVVRSFFREELGWGDGCPPVEARLASFEAALGRFDRYQALYESATDLLLADDSGAAAAMLDALAIELAGADAAAHDAGFVAIPELDVLRALAHLDRVARSPRSRGPCLATLPRQSALSSLDATGAPRGDDTVVPAVELAAARAAIERARAAGVPDVVLAGVTTCIDWQAGHDVTPTLPPSAATLTTGPHMPKAAEPAAVDALAAALGDLEAGFTQTDAPAEARSPIAGGVRLDLATRAGWAVRTATLTTTTAVTTLTSSSPPSIPDALRELPAWRAACRVDPAGFGDDGRVVWRADCLADWQRSQGLRFPVWLLASADGARVDRVARITRADRPIGTTPP